MLRLKKTMHRTEIYTQHLQPEVKKNGADTKTEIIDIDKP